jgi:hypothetical protein
MNLIFTNYLSREKSMIELKNSFIKNKSKILSAAYGIWIVLSIMLAYIQPHKYASYFTDLPNNLKNISPFLLSFAYLILFMPAIAVSFFFTLYILFIVIRNIYKK